MQTAKLKVYFDRFGKAFMHDRQEFVPDKVKSAKFYTRKVSGQSFEHIITAKTSKILLPIDIDVIGMAESELNDIEIAIIKKRPEIKYPKWTPIFISKGVQYTFEEIAIAVGKECVSYEELNEYTEEDWQKVYDYYPEKHKKDEEPKPKKRVRKAVVKKDG